MHQLRNIHRALDLIEDRLTEPVSIEELAKASRMSFWHFQRTFTAMIGEPAATYLRQRRLTEAARHLGGTVASILDIALAFQFESHEAFTRAFKQQFGLTPSAWRRSAKTHNWLRLLQKTGTERLQLSTELLKARFRYMTQTPEIVSEPSRSFMGVRANFIGAVSPKANNMAVIPKLWERFFTRIQEIPTNQPGVCYGLVECLEGLGEKPTQPDECAYLAALQVEKGTKALPGMTVWQTKAGTYAKFLHKGRVEKIGATMGYIYGKWLPESPYERAPGPEFEWYDDRFDPQSDDSILEIFVPLQKR